MVKFASLFRSLYEGAATQESDSSFTPSFGLNTDPKNLLSTMYEDVSGENKWKLSNIGGIGSDEDKDIREHAAQSESAFEGAGSEPGIEIWRIEKFEPEKLSLRADNLALYSGDCYIILKTTELEGGQFDWQLHYWIGKNSTRDESGSAAYFTVNIDDMLNQKPVQHREVQYSESELFHSYFKSVTYLDGGIDSGFKTVEPETYTPRLLQMTATGTNVRVVQVPFSPSSLNDADVFILDNGLSIFQVNTPNAHYKERLRAMEIIENDIKPERDELPELTILDGDELFECDPFWEILGEKLDSLPSPTEACGFDDSDEVDYSASKKLFRISDEDGLVLSLEKEDEALETSDINDDDVWVIVCDGHCFIHIGSSASKDEKYHVWNNCTAILLAAGLDQTSHVTFFSHSSDADIWNNLFA